MKPRQELFDPLDIVGEEIRAADGGNDGCFVLAYDNCSGDYIIQPTQWDTGLPDGICTTINECMIVRRYDVERPRVRTAEKR